MIIQRNLENQKGNVKTIKYLAVTHNWVAIFPRI